MGIATSTGSVYERMYVLLAMVLRLVAVARGQKWLPLGNVKYPFDD